MGRKAGNLYINPKKLGGIAKPCMKEMVAFLNCMGLNHCRDDKCEKQKQLLSVCMQGQVNIISMHFCTKSFILLYLSCSKWLKLLFSLETLCFCRRIKSPSLGETLTTICRGWPAEESDYIASWILYSTRLIYRLSLMNACWSLYWSLCFFFSWGIAYVHKLVGI